MAIETVNFVTPLHIATRRDYYARMNAEKPECMRVARKFDFDYWDGDRRYGYGGYKYDGRWKPIAEAMVKHYGLDNQSYVLDIGCGKGFLLKEFVNHHTTGLDCSAYALDSASNQAQMYLGSSTELPFGHAAFTLTYSINVFHNLNYSDLKRAIREMMRVSRDKRYICVESYRNEEELTNLQAWQLTCLSYYSRDDWHNILEDNGYTGDLELIYFE
jgi:protein-L-isoaspartate(D-aspartate) O-methyltransferase